LINEHLDSLEDSIKYLDKTIKEERLKLKNLLTTTTVLKPINQSNATFNYSRSYGRTTTTTSPYIEYVCTKQIPSAMNTTFEVRHLIYQISPANFSILRSVNYTILYHSMIKMVVHGYKVLIFNTIYLNGHQIIN
jgi:hypothetical protein